MFTASYDQMLLMLRIKNIMATEKECSSDNSSNDINNKANYIYEEERIKSFRTWQVHFPVDPIRLAKAGFYYTGNEDEVACFSCHGHIKNWNYGDVVQKKHAELFPNCDFVNNKSKNIPLIQSKKSNCSEDLKQSTVVMDESTKLSHIMSRIDYNKMKSLPERLKTFAKWPLSNIDITNVAAAGFFYLGFEDKVQCPFCKGIVSNWEAGDDPLNEHIKHFPWCNYLPDISPNRPKKDPWFQKNSEDLCGNMQKREDSNLLKCKLLDKNQEHADLKKLGVHLHSAPVHPQQASLLARMRSFVAWPSSAPVSKEELAKAGFFYIGISDHTKCFHCNGGLCNWELGDNPWFEHARWFRNCDFLRLSKGENFIESVIKQCHSTRSECEIQSPYLWSEPLMVLVDEAMRSELVMDVLQTGLFPHYVVRAAVLRQIKETGTAFSSERELCFAVSYLKEEMENGSLKMNNYQASDLNIQNIDFKKCTISLDYEGNSMKSNENGSAVTLSGISSVTVKQEENLQKDHCLCKICMDNEVGVVFLPCGHLLACVECAPALKLCPMCRKTIQATVRAYLP